MNEIIANIHIHTKYSDGSKLHDQIAEDAIKLGVDVLVFTDHNIHIQGVGGYYKNSHGRVLKIIGEEIHDQNAFPQKNHLLAIGINKDVSQYASDPQSLIDRIQSMGGMSYIAHPYDPSLPAFREPDISWEDWSIKDFTGIEIWNGFSELKVRVKNKISAYFYAFFPSFLPFSPPARSIQIWDDLLNRGIKTVAIGGSDAHAISFSAGFLKRVVFPYAFHLKTINNHILLGKKLTGIVSKDQESILDAIRKGCLFIANDLIRSSAGFRFSIVNQKKQIQMGGSQHFESNLKLNVIIPYSAECIIRRNGTIYQRFFGLKRINLLVPSPGIYRVVCAGGRRRFVSASLYEA